MAERLTHREGKHTVRIGNEWRRHDPVWDKLAQYEDLGFTPEEVALLAKFYKEHTSVSAITADMKLLANSIKWEEYEKLKEQGRLIELPCAVGDRIYRINQGASIPIIEMRVIGLLCNNAFIRIDAAAENDLSESCYFLEDFGKTVFLTKEEALAKLAEIRGTK